MEVKTHQFKTQKTARYASYGTLSEETKYFWFCLHGSKMTCEQMLYKFSDFDPETHFIIAPEALNRFYLKGFGGDVVASWMTSRDRLYEIEDFCNYLTHLYFQYVEKLPLETKRIVMGFSQGGTTLYRWLHNSLIEANYLIAYSCWIPEDINLKNAKSNLNLINQIYTYGLQDEFLTEERIQAVNQIIEKNKLNIEREPYEGTHRIEKSQLAYLLKNFIQYI